MKFFLHFLLQVDICQMGLDQRKVNMLARDFFEASKRNNRPIILSHRMCLYLLDVARFMFSYGSSSVCELFSPLMSIADMLPGIKEGQQKMSKSDPSSAIFMEDSEVISLDKCAFLNINNQFFSTIWIITHHLSVMRHPFFLYRNIYQSMFYALCLAVVLMIKLLTAVSGEWEDRTGFLPSQSYWRKSMLGVHWVHTFAQVWKVCCALQGKWWQ